MSSNHFRHFLVPCLALLPVVASAQTSPTPAQPATVSATKTSSTPATGNGVTELPPIQVIGESEAVSEKVDPAIGVNSYTITDQEISQIAQGQNTSFNQILAHTPGVSLTRNMGSQRM